MAPGRIFSLSSMTFILKLRLFESGCPNKTGSKGGDI